MTVIMQAVVSVDGFIGYEDDMPGHLFDWYNNGDVEVLGGAGRISKASWDYVRDFWETSTTMVIGRHLFDITNGWEGRPPTGEHVVVVSHRPKPEGWHPEASYHFATSVQAGIAKAKELAGGTPIGLCAGDVAVRRSPRDWSTRSSSMSRLSSSAGGSRSSGRTRTRCCSAIPRWSRATG
ncbi:hypothetical protein [Nocardioides turkmenicus]|uniref:hypothetical protein n=1 Tax=Nocardioides turkmenicus TaxID=2711220 RepID=UPI001F49FA83|nr:hypothetical protein [Nocardioides sp. KC13]